MKLFCAKHSPFSLGVQIIACSLENPPAVEFIEVGSPEATADGRNPMGKIPFLVDEYGVICESTAIARWLAAGTHWYPEELRLRAEIDSWVAMGAQYFGVAASQLVWQRYWAERFGQETNVHKEAMSLSRVTRGMKVLSKQLGNKKWLAGDDQPSIADALLWPFCKDLPLAKVEVSPELERWFGEFDRCEK